MQRYLVKPRERKQSSFVVCFSPVRVFAKISCYLSSTAAFRTAVSLILLDQTLFQQRYSYVISPSIFNNTQYQPLTSFLFSLFSLFRLYNNTRTSVDYFCCENAFVVVYRLFSSREGGKLERDETKMIEYSNKITLNEFIIAMTMG